MFTKQYRDDFRNACLDQFSDSEHWLYHPSYVNILVSSLGKVKNALNDHEYPINKNSQGYCYVHICPFMENRSQFKLVHRLVAETFYNYLDCENYEVNHIIAEKSNNTLVNLEWTTRQENLQHARDNNLYKPQYGENNANCRYSNKMCDDIKELKNLGFPITEIAKSYGMKSTGTVHRLLKRKY